MGTAEFQLAVHCCRSAFGSDAATAVDLAGIDWERFYGLIRFHRVQGLVWAALATIAAYVPAEIARRIAGDAARIAATNRASLAESEKLVAALNDNDVDFLILKGLPLGVLAYGTPWLKAGVDIDLLIDKARLHDAVAILLACGFRREDGRREDVAALRAWHRFRKDSEWWKPGTTARIDLHTRLTDSPALLPDVGLGSPRQAVEAVPGAAFPCLAGDELFAHLCVHGATSAWFRLKWITDLAALLRPKTSEEILRLYHRSQELGAGRGAAQALLLADRLYGSLDDCPPLRRNLATDPHSRWLYRQALRQLGGKAEPVEPTAVPGGTLRIHLTQFFLLPGIRFKASEAHRQVRAALA